MKIYEIGTGYTPIPAQMGAATEIVVEELTHSLRKLGQDVAIVDIAAANRADTDLPILEVPVPAAFTKDDVSLGLMHKLKRVVYSIALAGTLKKLLKQAEDKVVLHFHNQYNLFFFLKLTPKALRRKAVIAYTVHSYIWGTAWEEIESTVKKKYFQEVYCVQNADRVFVLNDITTDHFVTRLGVKRENIRKVRNGVNVEKYAPLPEETVAALRAQHDLTGKQVIFQVGSVCDRKNQLGSVQMLAEYMKEHPDVVFLYAGGIIDADYQQAIEALAAENGIADRVRYVGELAPGAQLNGYYNMADCSVFSSKLEAFGLVIIEALSAGVPVVLGSEPLFALAEGYVVYDDEAAFVSCVDTLLQAAKDGPRCYDAVTQTYNWDTVAGQHVEEFEAALSSLME